jgi:GNAT superfamily N-acetyltransferase
MKKVQIFFCKNFPKESKMNKKLEVKDLNIEHLAAVMTLQDKIIANFKPDEKHFILKRSANEFMKALDSDTTHMIGIFDGDRLVAQSIFELPQQGKPRDLPDFANDINPEDLVIYKATLVDVDYRGLGLMQKLLNYREKKAKEAGRKTAISQIAIDNPASWINALKNGMSIRKVARDPDDQAKVLYMQKDFYAPEMIYRPEDMYVMYVGKDIHKEIPALFNKMHYRAAHGFHGVGLDKHTNSIVWVKADKGKPEKTVFKTQRYVSSFQDRTIRN